MIFFLVVLQWLSVDLLNNMRWECGIDCDAALLTLLQHVPVSESIRKDTMMTRMFKSIIHTPPIMTPSRLFRYFHILSIIIPTESSWAVGSFPCWSNSILLLLADFQLLHSSSKSSNAAWVIPNPSESLLVNCGCCSWCPKSLVVEGVDWLMCWWYHNSPSPLFLI